MVRRFSSNYKPLIVNNMKKKYIAPSLLCVKIVTRGAMLQSSMDKYETGADNDVVLTREYENTFSNKNVWEEEW